jgi:DNA (cytosine-5)-methyltransferase 1
LGGISVIGELADIGYDAEWRIVSAASVGANHRRDRIIIVAYPQSQYGNVSNNYTGVGVESKSTAELGNRSGSQDLAYPSGERCLDNELGIFSSEGRLNALGVFGQGGSNVAHTNRVKLDGGDLDRSNSSSLRKSSYVFSFIGRSCDARTGEHWFSEPDVGRVANGVPSRVDRLRGLGNAVVPQVAEVIGRLVISDYQRRED